MALPQKPPHSKQFTKPRYGRLEITRLKTAPLMLTIHRFFVFIFMILALGELKQNYYCNAVAANMKPA